MIKSRRMRWARHVARMGAINAYKITVVKPEGKRLAGRSRRIWEDNIKMDLREVGLVSVDWIHPGQDRDLWRAVVNTVMNLLVPLKTGNFWTS
jgi:hypothetical protein